MANPIAMVDTALNVIEKLLDKLPDFDQRKKSEYFKLKHAYLQEKTREDRIDNHLEHYAGNLSLFLEVWHKELTK